MDGLRMALAHLQVVDDMDKLAAERDEEIRKIVESIEELSAIFKELAVLVIDQGTILDRIDYQMEQVVEQVEDGVQHLERAEEYQKSARPRYCICFLLITITILLTVPLSASAAPRPTLPPVLSGCSPPALPPSQPSLVTLCDLPTHRCSAVASS